jgi:hypothetical protein
MSNLWLPLFVNCGSTEVLSDVQGLALSRELGWSFLGGRSY